MTFNCLKGLLIVRSAASRVRRLRSIAAVTTIVLGLVACASDSDNSAQAVAISAQPTDQSVVVGTAATFAVVAAGATGYQWQLSTDGGVTFIDVNGATAASHTTSTTSLADNGARYRVVVSGAENSVTSSAVTLTVTPAPVAPGITVQPTNQTISDGQDATFTVTATGTTLNYQWQRSTDGGINFSNLAGANNATLSLTAMTSADSGRQFRVQVSNSAGSVTSAAALLTVNAVAVTPTFTTQPASTGVVAPTTATFNVVAAGIPSPTLQWQSSTNGGSTFADIVGATGSSYTTPATTGSNDGHQFRVVATNAEGSATSNVATLTVSVPAAPTFTTHPADVTITEGQSAQLTVVVTGSPTPTLQWQLSTDGGSNWNNIVGATGGTLNLQGVALANNGRKFRAVASNDSGTGNSNAATLTVNPASPLANIIFTRGDGSVANLDDLYVIKEDGSGEIQLTSSAEGDGFRAVSGGRVIYQANNNLFSVNTNGTGTVTLANTTDPEIFNGITPSGRVIYRRDTAAAGRDLWSVNADGTNPLALAATASHEDFVAITSSGKVIFSVSAGSGFQNDLYSINPDGTGKAPLAADPGLYEGFAGETASGLIVIETADAFGGGTGSIYLLNGVGGAATNVTTNTTPFEYTVVGITNTGQVIIERTVSGQNDIYGGSLPLAASADDERYQGSTASGQVIYSRLGLIPGTLTFQDDLYIVNPDGTHTVPLANTTSDEYFSAVAPDGRIIYTSCTNGLCDLYAVNADGTGNVPLANSASFQEFFQGITASGRVIYSKENGSSISLFAVNTDGTGTTFLPGGSFFVGTTPSNKVLIRNHDNGNANLYIVNADGTGSIPLANTGNNEFFAAVFE